MSRLQGITKLIGERLRCVDGAFVEPKRLTTSVHYRNVAPAHHDRVERQTREVVAPDDPTFVITPGHCVWEIRPRTHWNKGEALRWILRSLELQNSTAVIYVGDDRTDEDAFRLFPEAVNVKVGALESPTLARYRLPDPEAVAKFLKSLIQRWTARVEALQMDKS